MESCSFKNLTLTYRRRCDSKGCFRQGAGGGMFAKGADMYVLWEAWEALSTRKTAKGYENGV